MTITIEEYNQVIDGLRKQLELGRRMQSELIATANGLRKDNADLDTRLSKLAADSLQSYWDAKSEAIALKAELETLKAKRKQRRKA